MTHTDIYTHTNIYIYNTHDTHTLTQYTYKHTLTYTTHIQIHKHTHTDIHTHINTQTLISTIHSHSFIPMLTPGERGKSCLGIMSLLRVEYAGFPGILKHIHFILIHSKSPGSLLLCIYCPILSKPLNLPSSLDYKWRSPVPETRLTRGLVRSQLWTIVIACEKPSNISRRKGS